MHQLRSAQDLTTLDATRTLTASPRSFDGTLDELFTRFIAPNMPDVEDVVEFHRAVRAYVKRPDALFLLRQMRGTQRRATYATREGLRFKATDTAPAWWTHTAVFQRGRVASDAIVDVVATMPAHLYDNPLPQAISAAQRGWHLAAIFPVKDASADYREYSRRDLVSRFVRNVHPCNYFLIPKGNWQQWSTDARVIGYFADLHAARYAEVWPEFVALAGTDVAEIARTADPLRYTFGQASPETTLSS